MFNRLEPAAVELTLFTDALVIEGRVTTNYRRVTDILNQAEERFLVLEGVTIEEHGVRGQSVSVPFAQVNLDAILFATADSPVETNPAMRIVKTAERVVVSVPPFSVAGDVHLLVGDGGVQDGLRTLTEAFVPITNATYWSDQLNEGRRQALLVAVNHRRAHYIAPHRELDPWAGLDHRVDEAGSEARTSDSQGAQLPGRDASAGEA
jgi:hypothetical protein